MAVVADMEAGLEHLSWAGGTLRHVDLLLMVVNATAKTRLTVSRTNELARELGIGAVALVANRIPPEHLTTVERFAADLGCELVAVIPEDTEVRRADMASACILDTAPDSALVTAVAHLAADLDYRFARV